VSVVSSHIGFLGESGALQSCQKATGGNRFVNMTASDVISPSPNREGGAGLAPL